MCGSLVLPRCTEALPCARGSRARASPAPWVQCVLRPGVQGWGLPRTQPAVCPAPALTQTPAGVPGRFSSAVTPGPAGPQG